MARVSKRSKAVIDKNVKAAEAKAPVNAAEVKEAVEVKTEEVKEAAAAMAEEAVKMAEEKVEDVKEAVEKTVKDVKKAAAKTRKEATKKEIKTEIVLQYGEKEVNTKDMVAAVKKEWTKAKHKVSDIKSMELYIKPEDYAVYYVINGETTGKIWL
ncbi:DUF6465 family protein [bacterium]|uniref:DUF6465 family protein n=1 Tax=Lachnospiraceae TaxID=186803 RepID=UPI002A345895|nr:DUF6465 family protein [bacterium]MDY2885158.1 DUF6465 family protein [Bariatricus sp.]MCI7150752.1 DUF6465 family protein [bacterium]MDD6514753.1 DUF6465 family protein [bacterium]MDD7143538.1 DUF6465 family protein [bacterium]